MNSTFRIIRVRGIDIGANWSWLLIFGLIIFTLATNIFPSSVRGLSSSAYWTMAVIAGVLFVVSLLLHELGHAFRAQKEGMKIEGITLWLFGGVAKFSGNFPTAGAEFRIAIAGPLVTALLIVVFGVLRFAISTVHAPALLGIVSYLWQINGILLVFNMIPALPLDGGRVLRSYFWYRKGSFTAATVSAARVARFLASAMIAIGILGLLTPAVAPLGGVWLAFIGLFLLQAGRAEESYALFRQTLSGRTVRELMTPDPESVHPRQSLSSFIEDVAHMRGHSTYPVVDDFGRLLGLVSLRLAARTPVDQRATTTVGDVMVPLSEVPVVGPDADVSVAAQAMQAGPGRAVVMEDGHVAGILSTSDIARAIEIEQIRSPNGGPVPRRRGRRTMFFVFGLVAIGAIGFLWAPPFVVLAPGKAFDVSPDITITGVPTTKVHGQYVLTSVALQQPNGFGLLLALARSKEIAALSDVIPPGSNSDKYFNEQRKLFQESELNAAAAAARAVGLNVVLSGDGALVYAVVPGAPAEHVLKANDVIVAVDGQTVHLADEVARAIRSRPSGSTFALTVKRGSATEHVSVTSHTNKTAGTPVIGVYLRTHNSDIKLPFRITFKQHDIGGPSAGLAYALAVYDMLEKADIANGRIVATTGTMDLNGTVGAIGGIQEKAVTAREAGAKIFLVPAEEVNGAKGAGLDVRGVTTLRDAIDALKN